MTKDFLISLVLQEVAIAPRANAVVELVGLCLRVTKSGRVTPSKELAEKFSLEYGEASNGVDIFRGMNWRMLEKEVLIFGVIPRAENSNIPLWGNTKFKDGIPTSSIFNQSVSFGKTLYSLAEEMTDVKEEAYYDLVVRDDYPLTVKSKEYITPRIQRKGDKKGTILEIIRSGAVQYFPLEVRIEAKEHQEEPEPEKIESEYFKEEDPFAEQAEEEQDPESLVETNVTEDEQAREVELAEISEDEDQNSDADLDSEEAEDGDPFDKEIAESGNYNGSDESAEEEDPFADL